MLKCWIVLLTIILTHQSEAFDQVLEQRPLIPTIELEANPVIYSEQDAIMITGRAIVKQFNIEAEVLHLIDRYVPNIIVENVGPLVAINQVVTQRRFSYTWRF